MSQFDDRERAEEAKFAMDAAAEFKVMAIRNKMLGLWAAELMGLAGDEAEAYARQVVMADLEEPGDEDVFRKVRADFDTKGIHRTDAEIREHMSELIPIAKKRYAEQLA